MLSLSSIFSDSGDEASPEDPQVPLSECRPLPFPLPSEESSVEFGSVDVSRDDEQHPFPSW